MLRYRLITGPLLIALILGVVWLDEWWQATHPSCMPGAILFVVSLGVVALTSRETSRILDEVGVPTREWLTMATSMAAFATVALLPVLPSGHAAGAAIGTLLVAVFVASLAVFSRGQNVKGVVAATGGVLFSATYTGVLLAFWLLLRQQHSAWLLVGAILTTKSCDTGAYFTGVSIGRHKLIPWLSPKKTWEGLAGGVATAAIVGGLLALASTRLASPNDHLPWWLGAVGGVVVALVGQFGDLSESLFKRDAGRKDSGRLLPGMGGVLDVLDSPLMAGPAVYWLLALLGPA